MDDVLVLQARMHPDLPVDLVVVKLAKVLHVINLQGHLLNSLLARRLHFIAYDNDLKVWEQWARFMEKTRAVCTPDTQLMYNPCTFSALC